MREEKKRPSQDSSIKRFMKKRWAFPAIYIASAAIILSGVLWYQNSNEPGVENNASEVPGKEFNEPAVEVNKSMENFVMPISEPDAAVIQKQFYDNASSKAEQEASLIYYNNSYHPNTGIDISMKEADAFDVVAALSGTVTKVEEDSLLGNVIEIEHDKNIVTIYQSVKDMNVKVGDQVEQGQVLATAGKSLFNEEAGVHVHFEIRKDNVAVNPLDYFNKTLSALQEADVTNDTEATTDNSGATEENEAVEEEQVDDNSTSEEEAPSEEETQSEEGSQTEETDTNQNSKTEDSNA